MEAEKNGVCTCTHCEMYSKDIKSYSKPRWLTISPPDPWDESPVEKDIKAWIHVLCKLKDFAKAFVLVCELSQADRLHFHIMYDLKDRPKEWRYLKGWRSRTKQIKVFDGFPREGIHYMFKNIDKIKEVIEDDTPAIWTRDTMMEYFKKLRDDAKKCKLQRIQEYEDLDEGILRFYK